MDFERYLGKLPLLHTWDDGQTWNTGGFSQEHLRMLHRVVTRRFPDRRVRVIETGAGNSTITFLHLPVERVVSIAPAPELRDRIVSYCDAKGIDRTALDFRVGRSEVELPPLALAEPRPEFDVGLIDGGHGWPTVFVDFCYVNLMLRKGSLLLLDDIQIHTVAELSRLLAQQPGFRLVGEVRKLQFWKKETNRPFLPEHSGEPYILEMMGRRAAAGEAPAPVVELPEPSIREMSRKARARVRQLVAR